MQGFAAITLALAIACLKAEPECVTVYEELPFEKGQPLEFNCTVPSHLQSEYFIWDIDSSAPYSKSDAGGNCAEYDYSVMSCAVGNASLLFQADAKLQYYHIDKDNDICDFQCIFYIVGQVPPSTAIEPSPITAETSTAMASVSTSSGGEPITSLSSPDNSVLILSVESSTGYISPSTDPASSPGSPDVNSIAVVVVGIVLVGVVVVLVLLSGGLAVWCIAKGRRSGKNQETYMTDVLGAENSGFLLGPAEEEEQQLTFGGILLMDLVHNGTFKVVHHALFNTRDVIVKQLRDKESKLGREGLSDEISFIQELTDKAGQHPGIISLVGVTSSPDPMCLVLEYVPHGTLKNFLHSLLLGPIPNWYLNYVKGSMASHSYQKQTSKDLVWIMEQVADGAIFLAQNGCFHGNLSIRNVVLGDKLLTKLTNFGLRRSGSYYAKIGRHDYLQDMTPEALDSDELSAAGDVWSFGMLVFRTASLGGLDPYQGVKSQDLYCQMKRGVIPPSNPGISSELYFLLRQCWQLKQRERPNLSDILSHLRLLSQSPHSHVLLKVSMKRKGYIGNDGQAFLYPPPQSVYHGLQYTAKPSQRMSILAYSAISMTETEQSTGLSSEASLRSSEPESEQEEEPDGNGLPQEWVNLMTKKLSERKFDSNQHLRMALLDGEKPGKKKTRNQQLNIRTEDSNPSDSGHWSRRLSDDPEYYHEHSQLEPLHPNTATVP